MIVRSSVIGWDEALCSLQGYAVGLATQLLRNPHMVVNPLNSAVFFGGLALTEKLFFRAPAYGYVPGFSAFFGPIPVGTKNVVSYGLAIYTTLKIMQLAGLIFSIPTAVAYLGIGCAAVLAFGCVKVMLENTTKFSASLSYL